MRIGQAVTKSLNQRAKIAAAPAPTGQHITPMWELRRRRLFAFSLHFEISRSFFFAPPPTPLVPLVFSIAALVPLPLRRFAASWQTIVIRSVPPLVHADAAAAVQHPDAGARRRMRVTILGLAWLGSQVSAIPGRRCLDGINAALRDSASAGVRFRLLLISPAGANLLRAGSVRAWPSARRSTVSDRFWCWVIHVSLHHAFLARQMPYEAALVLGHRVAVVLRVACPWRGRPRRWRGVGADGDPGGFGAVSVSTSTQSLPPSTKPGRVFSLSTPPTAPCCSWWWSARRRASCCAPTGEQRERPRFKRCWFMVQTLLAMSWCASRVRLRLRHSAAHSGVVLERGRSDLANLRPADRPHPYLGACGNDPVGVALYWRFTAAGATRAILSWSVWPIWLRLTYRCWAVRSCWPSVILTATVSRSQACSVAPAAMCSAFVSLMLGIWLRSSPYRMGRGKQLARIAFFARSGPKLGVSGHDWCSKCICRYCCAS